MDTIGIAQSFTDENTGVAQQVLLGECVSKDVLIPAALGALAQYVPLSWDDTNNAYKAWASGEKVAAITAYAIPDSASDQRAAVYVGGQFNIDAINWPASTTEAHVLDASANSPLTFRKLLFSGQRVDMSVAVGPGNESPTTG